MKMNNRFWIPLALTCLFSCLRSEEADVVEEVPEFDLEACQRYAWENAPDLARQRIVVSNRVEQVSIAKAKFEPTFSVRRQIAENPDDEFWRGAVQQTLPGDWNTELSSRTEEDEEGENVTSLAFGVSKVLLGGGTMAESKLPIDRAEASEAQQLLELSEQRRRKRLQVVQRYATVVRGRLTLRLRELQLERAKQNLELAELKEDPLDIANARIRIPESELDVLGAEGRVERGMLDLRREIGMPVQQALTIQTQVVYEVKAVDWQADLDEALLRDEGLQRLAIQKRLAEQELRAARARRMPELRAELNWSGRDVEDLDDSETRGSLVLELPWLERVDKAEYRQQELDLEDLKLQKFEQEEEKRRSLEDVALRLEEARRGVEIQEQRLVVLQDQQRLYRDRWQEGEINNLEFIRSENNLEDNLVNLVSAKIRYLELLAEYEFEAGK